ncbi:MAG: hypothetical protein ACQEXX_25045 [Bacillota bacterium]
MSSSNRLPVHSNPSFLTECYHNFRLSVVLADPHCEKWLHSRFNNLLLYEETPDSLPMIRYEDHINVYYGVLEEKSLIKDSERTWLETIVRKIDRGWYVLLFVDWSRITISNHYGSNNSMVHELLIYGYDNNAGTFDILAFDILGETYGHGKIPYTECLSEFEHVLKLIGEKQWFAYYGFPAAQIRPIHDRQPQDYSSLFFSLERAHFNEKSNSISGFGIGATVNKNLAAYFNNEPDITVFDFTFWEIMSSKLIHHKQIMIDKVEYLIKHYSNPSLPRILDYYKRLQSQLITIKAYSTVWYKTGNSVILKKIGDLFQKMYVTEKRVISLFMEVLITIKLEPFSMVLKEGGSCERKYHRSNN